MPDPSKRFRTLFLSDIHLGSKGCQAEMLLHFLKAHEADKIYLVGDIVDGWRLRKSWYWPQLHNDVVQKLLRKARKGAQVIYVPGNHDEFLRKYLGSHFGGVEVRETDIHETVDGRKLLIIHGDQFDVVVRHARWLAHFGDWAYDFALWANRWMNGFRRLLGFQYWSLSKWAKLKVKNAVNFIGEFEKALAGEARKREVDGVVCGHIHHATITRYEGIEYLNTGDWVESCTALAENDDGTIELIDYSAIYNREKEKERLAAIAKRNAKRQSRAADSKVAGSKNKTSGEGEKPARAA